MHYRFLPAGAMTLVATAALSLAACSDSTAPTAPGPNLAVGDLSPPTPSATLGKIIICKAGNADGTFTVSGSVANGGIFSTVSSPTTVTTGQCKTVAEDFDDVTDVGSFITINETSAGLQSITMQRNDGGGLSSASFSNGGTLFLNIFHGYTITFTNVIRTTGCTLTQGYWKNHSSAWPLSSLTLGTVTYTQAQLLSILGTPVRGNGLIALAHQLIAAKLNLANGAGPAPSAIASADALIGSRVVPPVGSGSLTTSATSSLVSQLDAFNSGTTGPGHCDDTEPQIL